MGNIKQRLYIIFFVLLVSLSIYLTYSYRNLQVEMGKMHTEMYISLSTGIEFVDEDISRFEIDTTDNYSELLTSMGRISELKNTSRNFSAAIGSIYPAILRNIEVQLYKIINEDESTQRKEERLQTIKHNFNILKDLSEVVEEQVENNSPVGFFSEINSPNSNTSKTMKRIYDDTTLDESYINNIYN